MATDKEINMNRTNHTQILFFLILLFTSCENKTKHADAVVYDNPSVVEQSTPDTTTIPVQDGSIRAEEKQDVPVSSSASSRSNSSSGYDNMRGFDPASEDDMDDNGMSRYMENNDEEGWD